MHRSVIAGSPSIVRAIVHRLRESRPRSPASDRAFRQRAEGAAQYLSKHLTIGSAPAIVRHVLNQPAEIDRILQALADPTRRRILEQLGHGPASVTAVAAPLPMSLPAVVQHLQVLERSGLVSTRKVGRVRTCRLEAERLDTVDAWIAARRQAWERRLDRLGEALADPSTAREPDQQLEEQSR
jgi:DNA-binding transcriptional ArsR family regulator